MSTLRENYLASLAGDYDAMSKLLRRQAEIVDKLIDGVNPEDMKDEIKENECNIDAIELRFRTEIVNDIIEFAPKAGDLRRIFAILNMITDMERTGDLLDNISRFLPNIINDGEIKNAFISDIKKMYVSAVNMLHDVLESYKNADGELARRVIAADDEVDQMNMNIYLRILALRHIEHDSIPTMLAVSRVSAAIERIGDSATNIAESVVYFTDGLDVKHASKLGETEKQA